MTRMEVFAKAKKVLCEFYEKNEKSGILGIYLWGSITTKDFNPKTSDIDSVAIVDENVPIKYETKAIKALSHKLSGLSMRFIYLSELAGAKPRGNLARVADYRLLAADIPHWKHVIGFKIDLKQFGLEAISKKEVIRLKLRQIYRRNLPEIKRGKGKEQYFIKAMFRLCFYLEQREASNEPFSYSYVRAHINPSTKEVVKALFEVKNNNYDRRILNNKMPLFLNFLKAQK